MKFCSKCGAQLEDDVKFCPTCGENLAENEPAKEEQADTTPENGNTAETPTVPAAKAGKKFSKGEDFTADFEQSDIENNKILALFSYIGILFLIPMLAAKDSKYAKFHVNQGIILFILNVVLGIVGGIIGGIFGFIGGLLAGLLGDIAGALIGGIFILIGGAIGSVLGVVGLVLAFIGIYNAVTGKAKELPVIGKFRILK